MTTYKIKDLQREVVEQNQKEINGCWLPARPDNYRARTLWERITEAWAVFRGKLDTVKWPGGQ